MDTEVFKNRGVDVDMDTAWNRCPPNSASKLETVSMKLTSASSNKWGNIWTAEAPFPIIPIFFPFKLILLLFGHSAVCHDSPFWIFWSYKCTNRHGRTRPSGQSANKQSKSLSFEGCSTFELWNHWFMKSTNTTNEPIALHSRFLSIFFCSQFPFRSFFIPESFCYLSIESCIIRQSFLVSQVPLFATRWITRG